MTDEKVELVDRFSVSSDKSWFVFRANGSGRSLNGFCWDDLVRWEIPEGGGNEWPVVLTFKHRTAGEVAVGLRFVGKDAREEWLSEFLSVKSDGTQLSHHDEEARALLRHFSNSGDRKVANEALKKLVTEFIELAKSEKAIMGANQSGTHHFELSSGGLGVNLKLTFENGCPILLNRWHDRSRSVVHVPLFFNGATGQWEGMTEDTYLTPIPGQPKRRRAGVSMLTEMVVTLLQQERNDPSI